MFDKDTNVFKQVEKMNIKSLEKYKEQMLATFDTQMTRMIDNQKRLNKMIEPYKRKQVVVTTKSIEQELKKLTHLAKLPPSEKLIKQANRYFENLEQKHYQKGKGSFRRKRSIKNLVKNYLASSEQEQESTLKEGFKSFKIDKQLFKNGFPITGQGLCDKMCTLVETFTVDFFNKL